MGWEVAGKGAGMVRGRCKGWGKGLVMEQEWLGKGGSGGGRGWSRSRKRLDKGGSGGGRGWREGEGMP